MYTIESEALYLQLGERLKGGGLKGWGWRGGAGGEFFVYCYSDVSNTQTLFIQHTILVSLPIPCVYVPDISLLGSHMPSSLKNIDTILLNPNYQIHVMLACPRREW